MESSRWTFMRTQSSISESDGKIKNDVNIPINFIVVFIRVILQLTIIIINMLMRGQMDTSYMVASAGTGLYPVTSSMLFSFRTSADFSQ